MSKSWIRIVAIIAAAALVLGTVAAALGTWATADDEPPTPDPTPSATPSNPSDDSVDVTQLAQEALASFAAKLGVSASQVEVALREVVHGLPPQLADPAQPDVVGLRSAASQGLAAELGLPLAAVDEAITQQVAESYRDNQALVDEYLDRAVETGKLTADQREQFKRQLADGSIGTR